MKYYIHRNYSLTAKLLSGQQEYFQIGKNPIYSKVRTLLIESLLIGINVKCELNISENLVLIRLFIYKVV